VSENLKRKKRIGAEIEGRMLQVELTWWKYIMLILASIVNISFHCMLLCLDFECSCKWFQDLPVEFAQLWWISHAIPYVMATEVNQTYFAWSQGESTERDGPQVSLPMHFKWWGFVQFIYSISLFGKIKIQTVFFLASITSS
jgi:hypothetical protein